MPNIEFTKKQEPYVYSVCAVVILVFFGLLIHLAHLSQSNEIGEDVVSLYSIQIEAGEANAQAYGYDSAIAQLEAALESVGADASVKVIYSVSACNFAAIACVKPIQENLIVVSTMVGMFTFEDQRALMAHELGHVITNRLSALVMYTPRYLGVFDYDDEWIADCMAVVRVGYTISDYGYSCSEEQLTVASEIWSWYDQQ